jgi:hypothetical protein
MRKIIKNGISLFIAIIGLIGGAIWAYKSKWDFEPIILFSVSFLEVIGFFFVPKETGTKEKITENNNENRNKNVQNVEININNDSSKSKIDLPDNSFSKDRNAVIESKKGKVEILFIDDDTKFNIVKILKDSGWKNTKTIVDIKSIDLPIVQNADILFVDINGVGKILGLEYEGLDLALMLKQKYSEKKVIIYSAKKNSNSFHQAWDVIDARLEKNALPYQFQNIVENFSLNFYN